ncbi:MAG: hypothetical protein EA351_14195 [Gemmatimonadales bacterium]|nr:MAG: hypothetical protein EA351_14195 [Gemmatimonadales bacterium]
MRHIRPTPSSLLIAAAALLFLASCGDSSTEPTIEVGPEIDLSEIQPADQVQFDVEWAPNTIVAEESDVLSDVEDLWAPDGVYRVVPDSPLLDGLSTGDLVVWPQLGIFNILGIQDRGDVVEVATEWARFSDAVTEADIRFQHALTSGPRGRAIGVAPAGAEPAQQPEGVAFGVLASSGPIRITEDGVSFSPSGGGYSVSLGASGGQVALDVTAGGSGLEASLAGTMSGMEADGIIRLDPTAEDPDPAIGLFFNDITLDIDGEVKLSDSRGSATIAPNASLVFPFSIGPIPAFVAVSTRFQIRSSISRVDTELSASAGFSATGDVAVGRNPDGRFAAQGAINRFDTRGPDYSFEVSNTTGMGFDFDAPRITFGLGRPGLSPVAIYGTQSAELTFNVTFNTNAEWCARASLGGAVTVGGEINAFVWSAGTQRVISQRDGPSRQEGPGCSGGLLFEEVVESMYRADGHARAGQVGRF